MTAAPSGPAAALPLLLSPVDRVAEVEPLHAAGADELYGGVIPDSWRHTRLLANQRSFASAQFDSEAAIADAVRRARALGMAFHLTLNAPLYEPALYPDLLALAQRAAGWGAAGLIVGDPGLLARLAALDLPVELTLSTLAGTMNRESLAFFRRFPIRRAVLPRHLTLAETASLVASAPGLTFECFLLVGKCPNEEGHCSFLHVNPDKRWPCEICYDYAVEGQGEVRTHPRVRWAKAWEQVDRRMGCGLCAVGALRKAGVGVLKLVGRGGPTAGKIANVALARRFIGGELPQEEALTAYRERFGRSCSPLVCYYPELHPDRR